MYLRMIRNDILKSRLTTLIMILFVATAAMLVSLAAILAVNLTGAIDTLMTQAKTPHFMQMHSGKIDIARLEAFVKRNSDVNEFQVLEFLNADGTAIIIGRNSLSGSVQDNGFSVQSEKFDYLLDLNGNIIKVSDGEIYVPACYWADGTAKAGDTVTVYGKMFVVAGFLRDSQMNSLLASSKRFLISRNDYAEIKGYGNVEYLIEFRLKNLSALGRFENAYTSAGLEANGPTITYPLFKMLNAISDGLMIAVILLISVLVVTVAFLCIRFTLIAKIEDDYREIGVMKAIGMRVSDLKKIYLAKYAAVAASGCIAGFALSFFFKGMLLEHIRFYIGESNKAPFSLFLSVLGVLLVFLAMLGYIKAVLGRFRKISAAEAIRFGVSQEKFGGTRHFYLSRNKLLNTNAFLGIRNVLVKKRLYATMFAVLVVASFIILVPLNLYHTISSEGFIKYMGIGSCDIRIDIQQTDGIPEKTAKIAETMGRDVSISKFTVLTTKTFALKTEQGSEERIKVELGNHSAFPVEYSSGKVPAKEDEIALSSMNADELDKKAGDNVTLLIDGEEKRLTVCGIYSDITNGGKTAKAVFTDDSAYCMWSIVYAALSDQSLTGKKVSEYADRFEFAKVSDIDQYVTQTFGSTRSSIKKAAYSAIAVAVVITLLVTLLFMKMLVAKDRYSIAVMKALGFHTSDIRTQYIYCAAVVLAVAVPIGSLLANTLGEMLAGILISQLGASVFQFAAFPISTYLLSTLTMIYSVLIGTILGTSGIEQIKVSANIKE